MKITTVGIDLAKSVFQVHGVDERGKAVLRKKLKRAEGHCQVAVGSDAIAGWTLPDRATEDTVSRPKSLAIAFGYIFASP